MQQYFNELIDQLGGHLQGDEIYTANYSGEQSDFVRFNKSRIRQPGSVTQGFLSLRLIRGQRHVSAGLPVTGERAVDGERVGRTFAQLREKLAIVPEDPFLLYATDPSSSERIGENQLPTPEEATDAILGASGDKDLVGIYAQGVVQRGFANSLGQRNWFSSHSFNLDWSYYHHEDKAVKSGYAGFRWDDGEFERKVAAAGRQLEILGRDARGIDPGCYRVYLAPAALQEIMGMMAWGGFGKRAHATKQTAFLRMIEGQASLHPSVSISENTADGVAADFNRDGFRKPDQVPLIAEGQYRNCLVSPRSAREFDCETNGADGNESPVSMDMAAGGISREEVLSELGTGVCVNNLWYLNFSDRNSFRITGMTRFATFWVEGGEIVAPLSVMRFDESVYRMLGEKLVGLTGEREMILEASSYGERATDSLRVPGALIEDFRFTL